MERLRFGADDDDGFGFGSGALGGAGSGTGARDGLALGLALWPGHWVTWAPCPKQEECKGWYGQARARDLGHGHALAGRHVRDTL